MKLQPYKPSWCSSAVQCNSVVPSGTCWHISSSQICSWSCNFMVQEVDCHVTHRASHFLWLTPESPLGSECDSSAWKGGKYWINSSYSVGPWMKSELGCCKGIKDQTFQNPSAAMTVMTQSTHMVVVFLLCHIAYGGLSLISLNEYFGHSKKVSQSILEH